MSILISRTVAILLFSTSLLAQSLPSPIKAAVPGPAGDAGSAVQQSQPTTATPAAESAPVRLPAGNRLDLVLKTKVSSEKSKVGDVVEFEVVRPLKAEGLVAIAQDTIATAKVVIAEPRHRKGVGGKLAIAFDSVQLVNGDRVTLSGEEQRIGVNKREEINGAMGEWTLRTFGFGAPMAPLFLLWKGGRAMVEPGTRLSAYTGSDLELDRSVLERHQPVQAQDRAIVYLLGGWHTTCGSQALPYDDYQKSVVRIDLPPGQYWFHNGVSIGFFRAVMAGAAAGFTMGAVMPSPVSVRRVLKRPLREFAVVEVLGGRTYYLRAGPAAGTLGSLQQLEPVEGEKLVTENEGPYYRLHDLSPDVLQNLTARPEATPAKP